jgi:hypothetical protein
MPSYPRRYSSVPWLTDADLTPQGDIGSIVELAGGDEIAMGLWVREPFGRGSDVVLTIHATKGNGNDGGEVTLAITNSIQMDVHPVVEPAQSNPRRYWEDQDGC